MALLENDLSQARQEQDEVKSLLQQERELKEAAEKVTGRLAEDVSKSFG